MKSGSKTRVYRWWLGGVFVLVILVITLIVRWQEKSGGACYETNSADASTDSFPSQPLSLNEFPEKQETPQKANKPRSNSESYVCRLIAPANLPNIYLVFIGIGGIFAAIFTLEIISQQTDILRKSAEEAKKSAEAYISGERAWVAGELMPFASRYSNGRWYRFVENTPVEMSDKEIIAGQHLQFTLRLINLGKTPAFIVNYNIYCLRVKTSREAIAFGQPYRFISGGDSWDIQMFNISEYAKTATDADPVMIDVTLFYQHVFSKTDVAEEHIVYMFLPETDTLQRITGIPPLTYEKQQKGETKAN